MTHASNIHQADQISHDHASSIFGLGAKNDDFDSLALRVFEYQFQHNTPYQHYCLSLGRRPGNVHIWQDIPAVPTDAFKITQHPLTTSQTSSPASSQTSPNTTQRTFLTSGTTTELKGEHHFPSLALYEKSIIEGWKNAGLPTPSQTIFLTPSPAEAPHSSLSYMMGVMDREFSVHSTWAITADGKLAIGLIEKAAESNQPVALLGTALAFLHLFEQLHAPLPLAPESWAMETGGYKGSGRQLEKSDLYAMFESKLALSPDSVINEYSMTELSSQFYTQGLNRPHQGPPWTRIRVIDPATNTESPLGEPGHLVIYDLANLHSVMAIRTQDIAIAHGPNSFTLLGRDPSALPRGCSRAADHSLQSS